MSRDEARRKIYRDPDDRVFIPKAKGRNLFIAWYDGRLTFAFI